MSHKTLILGGGGYIGNALVDTFLSNQDTNFTVYDTFIFDGPRQGVNSIRADVRDEPELRKAIDSHDTIISLAATVGDAASAINPTTTLWVNRDCVKKTKEFAKGKKIITISSASVYGTNENVVTEETPTNPLSLYAYSKCELEKVLADSNSFVARLGTVFGLSQNARLRSDLVLNTLVINAFFKKSLKVSGGNQFRPLIHVYDIAEVLYNQVYKDKGVTGVYNLGYGNISITDLANLVVNYLPDTQVTRSEVSFEDARNYRMSCDKAKKDFDFSPKFDFDAGIIELIAYFKKNPSIDMSNPFFRNDAWTKLYPHLITPNFPSLAPWPDYTEELSKIQLTSVVK
jgi:nucleoside-diphosphate-sugar epimerase